MINKTRNPLRDLKNNLNHTSQLHDKWYLCKYDDNNINCVCAHKNMCLLNYLKMGM